MIGPRSIATVSNFGPSSALRFCQRHTPYAAAAIASATASQLMIFLTRIEALTRIDSTRFLRPRDPETSCNYQLVPGTPHITERAQLLYRGRIDQRLFGCIHGRCACGAFSGIRKREAELAAQVA